MKMALSLLLVLLFTFYTKGINSQMVLTTLGTSNQNLNNNSNITRNSTVPDESLIRFTLFTRENPTNGSPWNDNTSILRSYRPVKFFIHGYLESDNVIWYDPLTQIMLRKGDFSIFQVDWRALLGSSYEISAANTKIVGDRIGRLIQKIYEEISIPLVDFHIVAHSLGSHVAGFAGKQVRQLTGYIIGIITSLDAAGPLFESPPRSSTERLHYTDADVVENVHSDGGVLGYAGQIGTVDYFPNGGNRIQPGCGPNGITAFAPLQATQHACSHAKSRDYYLEAWYRSGIPTFKCSSYAALRAGNCSNNETSFLGSQEKDKLQRGRFYFDIVTT